MRLFEAKDLTKKYDKTVLNHLDFSIDEGEVVGIIGVSGCGKSTLARLVSGIEKPSSGSLLYQGKTVDFKKSRKDIQLILQNPIESFSPRMKIKKFLYFERKIYICNAFSEKHPILQKKQLPKWLSW